MGLASKDPPQTIINIVILEILHAVSHDSVSKAGEKLELLFTKACDFLTHSDQNNTAPCLHIDLVVDNALKRYSSRNETNHRRILHDVGYFS